VAKVSDLAERERASLVDATIDPEAEAPLGLTYQALAGLLADLYLQRHGLKASALAQVTAKNAAAGLKGGETYWSHAPSVLELARDLPAAPPLGRSDFAPILDGASAVLLADAALARELSPTPVEVLAQASRADWSVVADRPDPLAGFCVEAAAQAALAQASLTADTLSFVEISSACSILETIAAEGIGLCSRGAYGARCKEGLAPPVNPSGGEQGRGFTFGASGVAQAREIFLQLGPGAGARQVAAAQVPGATAMSVALGGLASCALVTIYRRSAS
jgi:acetyl-CoA acetyltransferase